MTRAHHRPRRLVVVAGTGTEVGKTWVAAALIDGLRGHNVTVAARKPAQSFAPEDRRTDAHVLASATGDVAERVCPRHRWYPTPMAPPMAADALGRDPIRLQDLLDEISASWPGRAPDVGIVELAGGVRSPLAHDGDGRDLIARLEPDLVVLVADAGLGTINSLRQAADDLAGHATLVLLNRHDPFDELHVRNRAWLSEHDGIEAAVDVASVSDLLVSVLPAFCTGCGRSAAECPGGCRSELDPPRHCPRCGRRLVVTIVPTGVSARCRDHGPLGSEERLVDRG